MNGVRHPIARRLVRSIRRSSPLHFLILRRMAHFSTSDHAHNDSAFRMVTGYATDRSRLPDIDCPQHLIPMVVPCGEREDSTMTNSADVNWIFPSSTSERRRSRKLWYQLADYRLGRPEGVHPARHVTHFISATRVAGGYSTKAPRWRRTPNSPTSPCSRSQPPTMKAMQLASPVRSMAVAIAWR